MEIFKIMFFHLYGLIGKNEEFTQKNFRKGVHKFAKIKVVHNCPVLSNKEPYTADRNVVSIMFLKSILTIIN